VTSTTAIITLRMLRISSTTVGTRAKKRSKRRRRSKLEGRKPVLKRLLILKGLKKSWRKVILILRRRERL
jgi:hypothetical protein